MIAELAAMIDAQPDTIESLAGVGPASALADAGRVWLIGTGTSRHAAELGASALHALGRDARAIASSGFTASHLRPGDAAVVITHTGQTAYARRARQLVLDAGVPLVSITGPDVDWPEAVRTPIAEKSETYTVSYTAALAVLARLTGAGPDELRQTADRVRAVLADPGVGDVPMPARAMAITGPGDWSWTAREGALKIREGARMLCEGFDPDTLLHGAAVPYGPADTLVVLQPDTFTAAVADAARREGIAVATLTDDAPAASPLLAQIPMTVRLQCLALRFAQQRAQNPDVAITGAWAEPALWSLS
jgi:glucosamine--fructose-6-phosphate aminotransferase (isomerizing)